MRTRLFLGVGIGLIGGGLPRPGHRAVPRGPGRRSCRSTPCGPTAWAATATRRGGRRTSTASAREGVVFDSAWSHCPADAPRPRLALHGPAAAPPRRARQRRASRLDGSHRTLATRFKAAGLRHRAPRSRPTCCAGRRGSRRASTCTTTRSRGRPVHRASSGAQQRDGAIATEALARWLEGQGGTSASSPSSTSTSRTRRTRRRRRTASASPRPTTARSPTPTSSSAVSSTRLRGGRPLRSRDPRRRPPTTARGSADHGEQEHGFFLYREAVQVPLLVRLPGRRTGGTRVGGAGGAGGRRRRRFSTSPASRRTAWTASRSARRSRRAKAAPRPVYSETFFPRYHFGWSELLSVTEERYRFIRAPRPELYDLREDPRETKNLAGERAAAVAAMNGWLEREAKPGEVAPPAEVSDETREALRALGYVGSTVVDVATGDPARPEGQARGLRDVPAGHAGAGAGSVRGGRGGPAQGPGRQPRGARRVGGRSGRRSCSSGGRRRPSRPTTR